MSKHKKSKRKLSYQNRVTGSVGYPVAIHAQPGWWLFLHSSPLGATILFHSRAPLVERDEASMPQLLTLAIASGMHK